MEFPFDDNERIIPRTLENAGIERVERTPEKKRSLLYIAIGIAVVSLALLYIGFAYNLEPPEKLCREVNGDLSVVNESTWQCLTIENGTQQKYYIHFLQDQWVRLKK